MANTAETIILSLSPKIAEKVRAITKKEGKTKNQLFIEALKRYLKEKEWEGVLRYGRLKAKEKRISEEQIEDIIDAYRR